MMFVLRFKTFKKICDVFNIYDGDDDVAGCSRAANGTATAAAVADYADADDRTQSAVCTNGNDRSTPDLHQVKLSPRPGSASLHRLTMPRLYGGIKQRCDPSVCSSICLSRLS